MTASTRGVVHVAAGPGIAARRILAGLTGGFSPRTMGGSLGAVPSPTAVAALPVGTVPRSAAFGAPSGSVTPSPQIALILGVAGRPVRPAPARRGGALASPTAGARGTIGAVPAPAAPAQPGSAVPLAGSGYAVRQGAPGGVVDDGVVRQSTGAGYADSTQPRGASQPRPRSLRR